MRTRKGKEIALKKLSEALEALDPAREARRLLRRCREGAAGMAELFALTTLEGFAGLPLTFIPLTEWLRLDWPDALPPWEAECEDADLRTADILFGAWLAWYLNFADSARARGWRLRVRRLSGEAVGRVLLEELWRERPPEGARLFAAHSVLVHPFADVPVCRACAVHDGGGAVYAAAVTWNTWVADGDACAMALIRWARRRAPGAEHLFVWKDPETREPFPFSAADVPWVVDMPVAEGADSGGRG